MHGLARRRATKPTITTWRRAFAIIPIRTWTMARSSGRAAGERRALSHDPT